MEHSIAAKYAARPVARFPRPSTRVRASRLGLRSALVFRAAAGRSTVLQVAEGSALARLRAGTRSIKATRPRRPATGRPRPVVTMTWARDVAPGRASAAAAPWRA